jgi:hypothetical protein
VSPHPSGHFTASRIRLPEALGTWLVLGDQSQALMGQILGLPHRCPRKVLAATALHTESQAS